jgi:hypothetical protein
MSVVIDKVSPIFYHPVAPLPDAIILATIEAPRSLNCSPRIKSFVETWTGLPCASRRWITAGNSRHDAESDQTD